MRCNALFYAILLPSVAFAHSGFPTGSGTTFPTGHAPGRDSTHHEKNHSHPLNGSSIGCHKSKSSASSGIPTHLPANETGIYTVSHTSKSFVETHQPFTKSSGLFFSNATSGFARPTGTGPAIHPSGTGAPKSSRMRTYTRLSSEPKPITSSASHFPYTKSAGAIFTNITSSVAVETVSGVFHTSGAGVSSGFAHPSGTALSSGMAKAAGVTEPLLAATEIISSTGRLPFSKSAGAMFTNTTSTPPAVSTGFLSTGAFPTTPKPTGFLPSASVVTVLPVQTKSDFVSATSGGAVLLTSALPTVSSHPLYTKSAGAMFTNSSSVSAPALSTGVFSTGYSSVVTAPSTFSTLISSPTSGSLNGTSTVLATTSETVIAEYYQCGGINWKGDGSCVEGTVCKYWNRYYSQCVAEE